MRAGCSWYTDEVVTLLSGWAAHLGNLLSVVQVLAGIGLVIALAPLHAQPVIDLSAAGEPASAKGTWRWHAGDDLRWASPDFDDRAWPEVAVPGSVLPKQAGAIWLRIHVKALPVASITLGTAPLAEASELYWNGQRLGGLGRFPPNRTPEYDIFPRSLIVDAKVPVDGSAVIALRLNRPEAHSFIPIQLNPDSLFAGSHSAVESSIAARYQFPQFPFHVFLGIEIPSWMSVLMAASQVVIGLYLILQWFSARELKTFLWLGSNMAAYGAFAFLLTFWLDHPIRLVVAARILSLVYLAVLLSFLELAFDLARIRSHWPRYLVFPVAIGGSLYELAFPAIVPPAFTVTYLSVAAVPLLGAVIVFRNWRNPFDRLLSFGFLPNFVLSILQTGTFLSYQSGQRFDLPVLAWERPFDSLFQLLANIILVALLAIHFQRSLERNRYEQYRMSAELDAARSVQQLLLNSSNGNEQFQVDAVYLPASEVGGDLYQVLPRERGSVLVVVGDVSGKGLKAALVVSVVVGALRHSESSSPAEVLRGLNRALIGQTSGGFVTCCCARFDLDGSVTIANAGNPAPYCDGREVEVDAGLPLGIAADVEYSEAVTHGERFTFVSDGVVEAATGKGELFGFDRTREISRKSAQEIADAARAWGQNDDITVVTVRRTA